LVPVSTTIYLVSFVLIHFSILNWSIDFTSRIQHNLELLSLSLILSESQMVSHQSQNLPTLPNYFGTKRDASLCPLTRLTS
jgi:hypothetical protein